MTERMRPIRSSDRAVSPVLGVILIVAITLILGLVIGSFFNIEAIVGPIAALIVEIPGDLVLLIGLNLGIIYFLWEIHEKVIVLNERTKPNNSAQTLAPTRIDNEDTNHYVDDPDSQDLE